MPIWHYSKRNFKSQFPFPTQGKVISDTPEDTLLVAIEVSIPLSHSREGHLLEKTEHFQKRLIFDGTCPLMQPLKFI